ncbi:MAG: hypothetical protein MMC23_001814 [Stictis urceolatum]|nr:hypothetical protein [Stictis urceolata]
MHFEQLPNELILHIYHSVPTVQDAHSLSLISHRLHHLFSGSQKLPILLSAAETQYGPLHDAIQIVTQNASQPAHHTRSVPISLALFKQLLTLGRAAEQWAQLYPLKKWKQDFENRRLLSPAESLHARRAIYRLWLYTRAFHNARFPRTTRTQRHNVLERAELLHNWSTPELAEMHDMHCILREVLQSQICPSNGTIQRKFRKRFPESDAQLMFNIHLNYPPPVTGFQREYYSAHQASASGSASVGNLKWKSTAWHEPGSEGWGDDIPHYYVVEDMLKLDPGQVLWLRENAPLKGMVEGYVKSLGGWFENNGETFGQTLEWVLAERAEDVEEIKEAVAEREMGIVID